MRRSLLAISLLSACGGDGAGAAPSQGAASGGEAGAPDIPLGASGSGGDGDEAGGAGTTGAMGNAGPWAVGTLPYDVTPGEVIEAPGGQWTFIGFPDSKCANGTTTGLALNTVAQPQGLLVFMQGGGACWDADTCLVAKASVHLEDEVGEATVLAEAAGLSGLFDHSNQANPFRDFAYAYMPYCTGDLHAGTAPHVYDAGDGPVTLEHHGGRNVEAYLQRLVATFPNIERVVVTGISAGGFGATFNWWRYQGAFPQARVDVWDDAGLLVDAPDTRFETMVSSWQMVLPPGCDDCGARMSAWLPFYGQHLVAPRRYALSGYLGDPVIGQYFDLTGSEIEAQMLALRQGASVNQKTFFLSGTGHSVTAEGATTIASDGSSLLPWILQYALDDAEWDHAGP